MNKTSVQFAKAPTCFSIVGVMLALIVSTGLVAAQGYRNRNVTMIVPAGPGGYGDVGAHSASALEDSLGKPFVIENRAARAVSLAAHRRPRHT